MSPITHDITRRVEAFARQHSLLPPVGSMLYVGLSGGPDSVALLHILHCLGYRCVALHCNFHLRGQESDRDMRFCQALCHRLGVELRIRHFDTRAYMHTHHLSLEMAARRLRYNWWATLPAAAVPSASAEGLPAEPRPVIALGHHQDDSIETLLMNLMRGTGIHGLTGIVPANAATGVVRPLLCLSRSDIMHYLADADLAYVTDSTNADTDTLRNQIRHQLLPLMEQLLPQAREGIAATTRHLQATALMADTAWARIDSLHTVSHSRSGLQWCEFAIAPVSLALADAMPQLPEAQRLDAYLHYWASRHVSPLTHRLCRTATYAYAEPLAPCRMPRLEYCVDGPLPHADEEGGQCQTFDADTVTLPLTLRQWHEGDRLAPLGMHGHTKLVSDLFTDAHYSPMLKATAWLLLDAAGQLLWVVGLRISDHHKLTPATCHRLSVRITG